MTPATIHGLPGIDGIGDLARYLELPEWHVWSLVFEHREHYRTFQMAKRGGGYRLIAHPNKTLKRAQRWVLRSILDRLHTGNACYGFERGSSLVQHAAVHAGARSVLTMDFENFFPSISIARVNRVFQVAGYNPRAASILAHLCCRKGRLPQGAPSSPKLANLACHQIDRRLMGGASSLGLKYSRYADDLSFSCNDPCLLVRAKPFIARIVGESGFRLNDRKTRIAGPSRARKVTGLVISGDSVGIGRQKLRRLRAEVHAFHLGRAGSLVVLQGKLDHVSDVDPVRYRMLIAFVDSLLAKATGPAAALRLRR